MKRLLALGLSLFMAADATAATLRPQDLARMQELSQQTGVPMSQISRATGLADFRQAVLDAYKRPAESKPWYEYEALFLTEKRIRQGVDFWRTHAADLARAGPLVSARLGRATATAPPPGPVLHLSHLRDRTLALEGNP